MKEFAHVLCIPLSNLINASFKQGKWPTIYKNEIITPAPKQYPPVKRDMLRPISNLFNFDKTMEKIVGELVIMDMKEKLDPKQFGNQRHLGIQHNLLKMIDRILKSLDNNPEVR